MKLIGNRFRVEKRKDFTEHMDSMEFTAMLWPLSSFQLKCHFRNGSPLLGSLDIIAWIVQSKMSTSVWKAHYNPIQQNPRLHEMTQCVFICLHKDKVRRCFAWLWLLHSDMNGGEGWSNSPVNWQEKPCCYFWPHVISLAVLNIAFLSSFPIIGHSLFSILTVLLWSLSKLSICFL